MVFLIQKAHNKDSLAIQLKLNELVAAHDSANNKLVNAEYMPEEELKIIQQDHFRLREDGDQNHPATHRSPEKDSADDRKKQPPRE